MKKSLVTQIYDLKQTFEENVTFGPFWEGKLPEVPKPKKTQRFLGRKVNSVFGVPACPLTVNARSISLLSKLGYDLITYKSVRSVEWRGNVFPHWLHVQAEQILDKPTVTKPLQASFDAFDMRDPSMANSFGIHSIKPEYWQQDVNAANAALQPGQLLILSLMPTPLKGQTLVDDSRRLAQLAAKTTAKVFEVNLACPNTDKGEGLIYDDLKLTHKICKAMKSVLGDVPLLVKVGYYRDQAMIKQFLDQNKDLIAGVSSTNTYLMPVEMDGKEAFPGRPGAGISGAIVRNLSMEQARNLVRYRQELGLDNLAVIGIGGVTQPKHIQAYLKLGVEGVQSAVGVWANPHLAVEYKKKLKG